MLDLTTQDNWNLSDIIGNTSNGLSASDIKRSLEDAGGEVMDDGER